MSRVWAVARLMISEGVRMKIALVFLMLIGAVVVGLPFSIKGDGSLTGAVQSFMQYGLSATGLLLGLLTILMARSLSDEVANRQILMVMTKPIPRWQFLLGKWLGMTLLNAAFLICSGATIYGMVHYIKRTHPPLDPRLDEGELNNEVLVARHASKAMLPDFGADVELEFDRNVEEGAYANVPDFDPAREKLRLLRKHEARWRIVGPMNDRVFEFQNVLCDRSPGHFIQLRYRTQVTRYAPDEIFRALWQVGDARSGTPVYRIPVRHVIDRWHTVRIRSDAVAADGSLQVIFRNRNPFEDERQWPNVMEFRADHPLEVMFVVGTFEWNLVRLLVLVQCKLMFLAAVSLLAVTVFSFPVACLTSLTMYVLAGTRAFIMEALNFESVNRASMFSSVKEFFLQSLMHAYMAICWVIPDFGRYDAVEDLVNGRNVGLVWVLQGMSELALVKTAILLGLAMLLFQRREVAEASF
ncbi:MAG: ABC transporter permease subunit [Planctomycetota bacterium]